MKRTLLLMVCTVLAAGVASAGLIVNTVSIAVGTNTSASATTTIDGYLDSVIIDVPAGSVTGDYSVVWSPSVSTVADVTIYTNDTVTADVTLRPRVDGSALATGAALTSDPPVRLAMPDDGTMTCSITNSSATGLTWKVIFIYEKPN